MQAGDPDWILNTLASPITFHIDTVLSVIRSIPKTMRDTALGLDEISNRLNIPKVLLDDFIGKAYAAEYQLYGNIIDSQDTIDSVFSPPRNLSGQVHDHYIPCRICGEKVLDEPHHQLAHAHTHYSCGR